MASPFKRFRSAVRRVVSAGGKSGHHAELVATKSDPSKVAIPAGSAHTTPVHQVVSNLKHSHSSQQHLSVKLVTNEDSPQKQATITKAEARRRQRSARVGASNQPRFSQTVRHRTSRHKNSGPDPVQMALALKAEEESFGEPSWRPLRHEIALIRRSWPHDDMIKEQIGTEIYSYIFEREPETLSMFPSFGRYGLRLGLRSDEFFLHLTKFVNVLEYVIDNLHQPPDVIAYLRHLGSRHSKFIQQSVMKPYYWRVFGDGIAHAAASVLVQPQPTPMAEQRVQELTAEQLQQIVTQWRHMGEWIMLEVRHGYREAIGVLPRKADQGDMPDQGKILPDQGKMLPAHGELTNSSNPHPTVTTNSSNVDGHVAKFANMLDNNMNERLAAIRVIDD